MQITNTDIIKSFWQQGANNCASIGLIKAAIDTFGLYNIFELLSVDGIYTANLRDGLSVSFTEQNLQESIRIGSFQRSRDTTIELQQKYEEIRGYAQICFAVMVACYKSKNNLSSYDEALTSLANGANARYVSKYLGLEHYASGSFRGGANNSNMIAWQHNPFLKHVVYMSKGVYDNYGKESPAVKKFPKRIMFQNSPQQEFVPETNFSELNFINISKYGTFHDTGNVHSIPQQVDQIFNHIRDNGISKLLINFHGGLISENRGMDSAESFYDNFNNLDNTHTVSIVWETGLFEALPQAFLSLLQSDELLRKILVKVAKYFGKKLNIDFDFINESFLPDIFENYAAALYQGERGESEDELQALFSSYSIYESDEIPRIFAELSEITSDELLAEVELERLRDDEGDSEEKLLLNPTILWVAAKIIKRCVRRFVNKRGHGLLPTIVEEGSRELYFDTFGTEVWKVMKNQAKDMWKSNQGRSGNNQFAGRYLMDKLLELAETTILEVHAIGHSAGTIAICEWIKALKTDSKYSNLKFKNIIFLAPACRCDLFKDSVMRYTTSYENFTMYTMHDQYEKKDNLIPVRILEYLYPRSLLYLISGILEGDSPKDADAYILGMHRHIRKERPYSTEAMLNEISDFLFSPDTVSCKLILSKSKEGAIDGRRTGAVRHGGFGSNDLIVESIRHIVK